MRKSRLVLLDANVIIHLFELKLWDRIVDRYEVVLAETVIEEADFYMEGPDRIPINLQPYIAAGRISVIFQSASDIRAFKSQFGIDYVEKLDPGEAESLAYLVTAGEEQMICSADKIVYRVLGSLNLADRGISLEEVLERVGLGRAVPRHFSRGYREEWTRRGFADGFWRQG